jgi:hypothetical protein
MTSALEARSVWKKEKSFHLRQLRVSTGLARLGAALSGTGA